MERMISQILEIVKSKYAKKQPFIGIVFNIGEILYFAPLTSPKPKFKKLNNKIDFYKLKNGELGAINFNNMK